jgi:hypothetical protein
LLGDGVGRQPERLYESLAELLIAELDAEFELDEFAGVTGVTGVGATSNFFIFLRRP